MRTGTRAIAGTLAGLWLAAWAAVPAGAQPELAFDDVGAALALPFVTDETSFRQTYASVTNLSAQGRVLRWVLLEDDWDASSGSCSVTSNETVLFQFTRSGGLTTMTAECDGQQISRVIQRAQGILFLSVTTDGQTTVNSNDLIGDASIADFSQGWMYSVRARSFLGLNPLAPGVSDRFYLFDNEEYSAFPEVVATNFLAPNADVTAELLLATLDGTRGESPQILVRTDFFNDDEAGSSAIFPFDCFTIIPLQSISPSLTEAGLGSESGHLYLRPLLATQSSAAHDTIAGNGNGVRVVPFFGWLIQTRSTPGGPVAWARTLTQGLVPVIPEGSDIPTFNAP